MTNVLQHGPNLMAYANDIEEDEIDRAVKEAVLDALRDHKKAGNPVAVWEDGKVKIIQPEDMVLPDEPK
jgi:hypothetical protein